MTKAPQGGHSARVKMRLLLNGNSIPVVQMGPDFLILKSPIEHPPSDATLELCVDASERRWKVRLPNGISSTSRTVMISRP
jgi:hypothetical protein